MAKSNETVIKQILATLNKIKYGSVLITIHDGEITQIDSTEKNRFVKNKQK